jgi:acetyl esterase/lipase
VGPPRLRRSVATTTIGLVALVALPAFLSGCGGSPSVVGTERTYTYCTIGGIPETLDVYGPTSSDRSAPAVVDIHGGGWVSGDSRLQPGSVDSDVKSALVGKGWVFVSINYRLAPSSPWPAQIEDAKCAVRYLRANASALHIDPTRIGVIGASAGGHLASLVGLTGNQAVFEKGGSLDESSAVEAVVDEYGPADLTSPDWSRSKVVPLLSKKTFGVTVGSRAPVLVAASPVTYVHAGAPPFLVIQGVEDMLVPASQSEELVSLLKAAGDQATLILVQNAGHGLLQRGNGPITPSVKTVAADAVTFLTMHLSTSR